MSSQPKPEALRLMANAIRFLSMDAVQAANSGHPGMPMGMADVAAVLFSNYVKYDPKDPNWADRDRFVLSAGHGSMLLYSLLHLTGYPKMTIDEIRNFRQLGSITAGHPEYGHAPGIETTTGPLGQGLATAVGMAMGERMMNAAFGDALVDHRTWVIAGDGCLMEGISHEAISLAGHMKLNKLVVIWDDNNITIDGDATLSETGDIKKRFEAANWDVLSCDAHDFASITAALDAAITKSKPVLIAAKSIIGKGAPNKQGGHSVHGSALGPAEVAAAREALGWPYPAFEVPDDIRASWKAVAAYGAPLRAAWEDRLKASDKRAEFERRIARQFPKGSSVIIAAYKEKLATDKPKVATRKASEMVLEVINAAVPEMIGGSADLTGSNNTKTKAQKPFLAGSYDGTYVHWGVREFGMSAAMNGLALHGGLIPYSGGFLIFSDYARPAIRLAALMGVPAIHVLTHDSIGLGEDGPTHQPVEHLAALRAIPNLTVIRPADAMETAEAWEAALANTSGPTALILTRQNLPAVRGAVPFENQTARGAYVLKEAADAKATIFATGSEVEIALAAAASLDSAGIAARVVSMPSFELFEAQDEAYRAKVLGEAKIKVAIEAAIRQGWDRYIGQDGIFIGMTGFGASAPAEALYKHFGITAEAAVNAVKAKV
jgi:transketolase